MKASISTLGFVAALAVGCASSPPAGRVASTETAVQSARASGVDRSAEATNHLQMAEQALDEAKAIIKKDGYTDQAQALLMRADSDAALAAALSREAKQESGMRGEPQKQPVRAKQPPAEPQP
jgi:hypothetical protein